MTCADQNPLEPYDAKRRAIACLRPDGHTRCHKGRGRIWGHRHWRRPDLTDLDDVLFTAYTYAERRQPGSTQ